MFYCGQVGCDQPILKTALDSFDNKYFTKQQFVYKVCECNPCSINQKEKNVIWGINNSELTSIRNVLKFMS